MARTNFTAGFKDTVASPYGLGAAAGFLALMVLLYWFDMDPASIAAKIREKVGG